MVAGSASFASAADVDGFFNAATGQDFVSWFNDHHAGKGSWAQQGGFHAGVIQAGAQVAFQHFCDHLPTIFGGPASLEEFLCLTSIVINETASFLPISELVGTTGHPGIAYAFDEIQGLKRSYNIEPLNRLAGDLFRDPQFLSAHGNKPQAPQVANTTDPRWNGTAYPQGEFPISTDPGESGIILEADFYKFRGRGLIQTTFRSNYAGLIAFVKACNDPNPVIQEFRGRWAALSPDEAATVSSNADWDRLYQETDCIVALEAIRQHSQGAGNYLAVSSDRDVLAGQGVGSAFRVGNSVSGSSAYGHIFSARVLQLIKAIPAQVQVEETAMKTHNVPATWWKDNQIAQSPAGNNYTMQAATDFGLPAGAQRVRFGVYLAAGTGYLRFFNADGSEAEPVGWGGAKPVFGSVEVTLAAGGTVAFRVEDGPVITSMVRSLGYWA